MLCVAPDGCDAQPRRGPSPELPEVSGVADRESLLIAFRLQVGGCSLFGSPFYSELMQKAYDDVEAGGRVGELLATWQGDPVRGFLPLRLFGAVHDHVLAGHAPELARYYPTAGGRADADAAWPAFEAVVAQYAADIAPRLEHFPQTNEVRRCAGLLGGFLEIAERTALPLRHYALGPHTWGDRSSPVGISTDWSGAEPCMSARIEIESRAGCDLAPRRIDDHDDARVLESFVWADQPDRLEELRAAIELAKQDPPRVEEARARDWLPAELAAPAKGLCRVVFHSSLWLYLERDEQNEIRDMLTQQGARATRDQPLAWLRHEDGAVAGTVEIRLTRWPGGEERLLGMGHPHGRRVKWHGR